MTNAGRAVEDYQWLDAAAPAEMDALWAAGWRHFGARFFRCPTMPHRGQTAQVRPLRIDVAEFVPSASQKRIVQRNAGLAVTFPPAAIDAERQALFQRHRVRFTENIPDQLEDFLSENPAVVPCRTLECDVRDGAGKLLAASYLDLGERAASAVFAMFEPAESRRSLGLFLILSEIAWCRAQGRRWLYLGYSYDLPSAYDYKKRFAATERYDWPTRSWVPVPRELSPAGF
jgi:leucyl-tRNA---protein transferase